MWKGMQKAEGRRRKAQMRHAELGKHGWQGWARMAGQACRMESGAGWIIQISHCENFDMPLQGKRLRKGNGRDPGFVDWRLERPPALQTGMSAPRRDPGFQISHCERF